MDTQNLRAFLLVAESGSFSKAAKRLHLTQPAVSKRIAQLETQLNVSLFDRIGRRISTTEAGEALLPHARAVHLETAGSTAVSARSGRRSARPTAPCYQSSHRLTSTATAAEFFQQGLSGGAIGHRFYGFRTGL